MNAAEQVKQLQEELEHRTEVEHQAEQLIVNGEYEKAKELLQTQMELLQTQIMRKKT